MKRRYQINREKAVRRFQEGAGHGGREIQLHLPLKEIAAALQRGVGELMRQAGLELMQLIMEDEVRQLAGERYQRGDEEQGYRWGHERGFLVVDGQKTKIARPRVRSGDGREQQLGSYELFRRGEPLDETVWNKLMLGLSTRNYSNYWHDNSDIDSPWKSEQRITGEHGGTKERWQSSMVREEREHVFQYQPFFDVWVQQSVGPSSRALAAASSAAGHWRIGNRSYKVRRIISQKGWCRSGART